MPELLGVSAHRALGRGELAPALRATRDRSPLATLTRLFLLGATEDEPAVAAALPRTGIADAVGAGRAGARRRRDPGRARHPAVLGRRAEFLLVSDLDSDTRPGPVRRDHVLGIGAASVTLARAVIREPVDRALDVGTGCGIQALHLAGHAGSVVATDVNPRALALAAATARLNGQHWDLRAGSMYEPVAGEDFDLIVCNPPFVIGDGEMRYSYRDSGLAGDGICQALIEGVAAHLRPGGTAQLLANWIVREDTDWRERVGALGGSDRLRRLGGAARAGRPGRVCRALADRRRRGRQGDRGRTDRGRAGSPRTGSTTWPPNACRASAWG